MDMPCMTCRDGVALDCTGEGCRRLARWEKQEAAKGPETAKPPAVAACKTCGGPALTKDGRVARQGYCSTCWGMKIQRGKRTSVLAGEVLRLQEEKDGYRLEVVEAREVAEEGRPADEKGAPKDGHGTPCPYGENAVPTFVDAAREELLAMEPRMARLGFALAEFTNEELFARVMAEAEEDGKTAGEYLVWLAEVAFSGEY